MKISLFEYNRKETDNYFGFLNKSNTDLGDEVEKLKAENEALRKRIEENERHGSSEENELKSARAELEEYKSREEEYKRTIEELHAKIRKSEESENEKLGFIFAVAYRDMESKNKAVSSKIKEYANMMFDRMSSYRNEVAKIIDSVNDMQNRQREALKTLCDDASEKLRSLTEASDKTIRDMEEIEEEQDLIMSDIDGMIKKTIDTSETGVGRIVSDIGIATDKSDAEEK